MTKMLILAAIGAAWGVVRAEADFDAAAFRTPAHEYRPETWFHLIGGNVSSNGITADLEAIAAAGLSGIQLFHGQVGKREEWPGVERQTECLSPAWEAFIGHVANECKRLGLTYRMQNCPGWSLSGGPWMKPSEAMRDLCWMTRRVTGGKPVTLTIPTGQPKAPDPHDYRDLRVFAFPTPVGSAEGVLEPVAATTTGRPFGEPDAFFVKGLRLKRNDFNFPGSATQHVVTATFARPVTVRTLELSSVQAMNHANCYVPKVTVSLAVEENGAWRTLRSWPLPQSNWQDNQPLSLAVPETTAARWRVTFDHAEPITVSFVRFRALARPHNWESDAANCLRALMREEPVANAPGCYVDPAAIRDVTSALRDDGTLALDLPPGDWTVVRLGQANKCARNGPAPAEATGWECDKLGARGIEAHYPHYIGHLAGKGGPIAGKLTGLLVDSWECLSQSWTPGLDAAFKDAYGYSLEPWWPALMGFVVKDRESTYRFLRDWRVLIGKRVAREYYGRMAELAHADGFNLMFQTAAGDVFPGDILEYFQYADIPMCEFWHGRQPRNGRFVGHLEFKPIRPTVSAARLYGKRRIAAESFTGGCGWDESPLMFKPVANAYYAKGITHTVFHTYTHNPRVGLPGPGTSFGVGIGAPLNRCQTWWTTAMPKFTEYMARCNYALECGNSVSDVLLYLGDEQDHKPSEYLAFPEGYAYDYCNPDALLRRVTVKDGRWTTPEGLSWRLLWLRDTTRMTSETLAKIAAGLAAGGAVLGEPPKAPASLATDAAAFDRLVREIWGRPRTGVFRGADVAAALAALGVAPDVKAAPAKDPLVWLHRRTAAHDLYFVCADYGAPYAGEVRFRATGAVAFADPNTGAVTPVPGTRAEGDFTVVPLDLARGDARFVMFTPADPARTLAPAPAPRTVATVTGPWQVSFPAGWGQDAPVTIPAPVPIRDMPIPDEARAFSGTVRYVCTFDWKPCAGRVTLDLGRVECAAVATLNGKNLGTAWSQPFAFEATEALKPGANTLVLDVVNPWRNRLLYDGKLPPERRKTWTNPYPQGGLHANGLLGPVTLRSRGE